MTEITTSQRLRNLASLGCEATFTPDVMIEIADSLDDAHERYSQALEICALAKIYRQDGEHAYQRADKLHTKISRRVIATAILNLAVLVALIAVLTQ